MSYGILRKPKINNLMKLFFFIFLLSISLTFCSPRPYQIRRAEILYRQGQSLSSKGEYDQALKKFQRSIELAKRAKFKQGIAHNLNEIAIILTARRQYSEARNKLVEALAIYKELKMNPEVSKALNNIALTYLEQHNFSKAIEEYNKLIQWDTKTGNELGVAITLNNLGHVYERYLNLPLEAKEKYIKALKIFEKLGNEKYATAMKRKILRINMFVK